MKFKKINKKIITISIILLIILLIIFYNYKIQIYFYIFSLLLKFKLKFLYTDHYYLYNNFYKIFKNNKIENINSNNFNKNHKINVDKNKINQYTIINMIKEYNLVENIVNNININNNIYKIIEKVLLNVNLNGKNININDCVVVDLLKSNIQSFPAIHTDIEWYVFDKSDGFQIWYLYENYDEVGNMFLFDTNMVKSHSYLIYNENDVLLSEQCGDNIINKLNHNDINPKIKYLNMIKGECLIFGKNLYHMSDFRKSKYRYSLNFRVVIRDSDGGIPINLDEKCLYVKGFKTRLMLNNVKIINNKIYPKMFDLINLL